MLRTIMCNCVTMSALALLEDVDSDRAGEFRGSVFSGTTLTCWHTMMTGSLVDSDPEPSFWSSEPNDDPCILPVPVQVLTTHRRSLLRRLGNLQSSLSRTMPAPRNSLICRTPPGYIKFPYTVAEQADVKVQFAARSRFPNVIGAIDCTHIAIRAPSESEFVFENRNRFRSTDLWCAKRVSQMFESRFIHSAG